MAENAFESMQLLNAKALGQLLSLSKQQIFRLNSCAKIPRPLRIGGAIRWSAEEINSWLSAGAPDRCKWESIKKGECSHE